VLYKGTLQQETLPMFSYQTHVTDISIGRTRNRKEQEYASTGKGARLEEKFLQRVIIFLMIATHALNFISFGSSISPKGW